MDDLEFVEGSQGHGRKDKVRSVISDLIIVESDEEGVLVGITGVGVLAVGTDGARIHGEFHG